MTTKEFNNLEEIQKYYDVRTNTYVFKEGDEIKVELVEGYYTNVLIKPDGRKYFVTL